MEKFVPLNKMSKKKQREYYKAQRRGWGGISPVTRLENDPKAYNRAKAKRDSISCSLFTFHSSL